jgi:hypothetical protein
MNCPVVAIIQRYYSSSNPRFALFSFSSKKKDLIIILSCRTKTTRKERRVQYSTSSGTMLMYVVMQRGCQCTRRSSSMTRAEQSWWRRDDNKNRAIADCYPWVSEGMDEVGVTNSIGRPGPLFRDRSPSTGGLTVSEIHLCTRGLVISVVATVPSFHPTKKSHRFRHVSSFSPFFASSLSTPRP